MRCHVPFFSEAPVSDPQAPAACPNPVDAARRPTPPKDSFRNGLCHFPQAFMGLSSSNSRGFCGPGAFCVPLPVLPRTSWSFFFSEPVYPPAQREVSSSPFLAFDRHRIVADGLYETNPPPNAFPDLLAMGVSPFRVLLLIS